MKVINGHWTRLSLDCIYRPPRQAASGLRTVLAALRRIFRGVSEESHALSEQCISGPTAADDDIVMLTDQLLRSWMHSLEAQWRVMCGPRASWPRPNVDVRKVVVAGAPHPENLLVELHGSKREPLS